MDPEVKKQRGQPRRPARAARNYVFRISFPATPHPDGSLTFKNVPRLLDPEQWPMCKYCIYSLELTFDEKADTENFHFQGYLELNGMHSMTALHQMPGLESAHFEVRRGSQQEAIMYCSKTYDESHLEGPWEWGVPARQGQRSDLLEIQIKIHNNMSLRQLSEEHFASFMRHGKSFKEYKRQRTAPRNFKSKCFLFVGPPGEGKSTLAKLIGARLGTVYKVPQKKGSGLYFDDYDGQDVLFLDEMNGNKMSPEDFNSLVDEHEHVLTVHGGAGHQMVSKYIFIVSNYAPQFWWRKRNASQLYQTTRRIDVVFKVGLKNMPRWDHSGFQVFGPNINQPQQGDLYPPEYYDDLPPLEEGHAE